MPQMSDSTLQRRSNGESDDKNRGRRRSRIAPKNKEEGESSHGEALDMHSSGEEEPTRKRRRSRKGLDKKFECPSEGCGKSYSRAEHL
jgi:hypothetical protein